MKKYLLFFSFFVLSSLGVRALPSGVTEGTWSSNVAPAENVLIIDNTGGNLATVLADGSINLGNYGVVVIKGEINDADVSALSSITTATIDLQDANWTATVKTFANSSVVNLILPDGWTQAEVNAVGSTVGTQLGSCISQQANTTPSGNGSSNDGSTLIAYINKGNTLYDVMSHCYYDGAPNKKLNSGNGVDKNNIIFDKIKTVVISGYPVARDLCGGFNTKKFDANGHFVFNEAAKEAPDFGTGISGSQRVLTGTEQPNALNQCVATVLDLSGAVIPEEYNADLTLSYTDIVGTNTQRVIIPTSSEVKTLPADFLNVSGAAIRQICIPSNIENIKTRAFYSTTVDHIWTTNYGEEDLVVDNGVVIGFNEVTDENGNITKEEIRAYGYRDLASTTPNVGNPDYLYGSFTFSSNLKLIESYTFGAPTRDTKVKDVWVLAVTAPECHVNAFNSIMYVANNTYDQGAITEGIITREAYVQSASQYNFMTMLHYPRECGTPDIQRYTDPTREYSIATGLKDGKGGTIYFPNMNEFKRAYSQGTYGYVWHAWDDARKSDGSYEFVYANDVPFNPNTFSKEDQQKANDLYLANEDDDKYDRTFYDTTFGGELARIEGQKLYTQVVWEGKQLYPEAVIVEGDYVYVENPEGDYVLVDGAYREYNSSTDEGLTRYSIKQEQALDAYGYKAYEVCPQGTLVKDWSYEKDDNGNIVWDIEFEENVNGTVVKDYEYVKLNGNPLADVTYYYHPMEQIQNGDANKWSTYYYKKFEEDANGEWYKKDDGNYYHLNEGETTTWPRYSMSYAHFSSQNEYYSNNYRGIYLPSESYKEYNGWAEDYAANVSPDLYYLDYIGYHNYDEATDNGKTRYNVTDNGFRLATADDAELQHYSKIYKEHVYREFDENVDPADEPRYCPTMLDVKEITVVKQNDYHGWHQFVLTGYGYMGTDEIVPYRSYIKDNDWWTICLPFDLTRSELIKLYGTEGANPKIPYLSELVYVIRDVENQKIRLMFSNNLLEYKENVAEDRVHGTISTVAGGVGDDDIVLHKGVPYLIRPYLTALNGSFKRQFDIEPEYKNGEIDPDCLYSRIKDSETMHGNSQKLLIYNGEYTVPAYVVNNAGEAVKSETTITNKDGSSFTYQNGTITYKEEELDYMISDAFTYTFVGSFYLSLLPQNCYFLGWDSSKNRAAFWYNAVADGANWTWANETGIICPNWNTNLEIHAATSLSDPARWIVTAGTDMVDDSFSKTQSAKTYDMEFGAELTDAIHEVITETDVIVNAQKGVYTIDGQYLGASADKLAKGLYIVNGKKYIVK